MDAQADLSHRWEYMQSCRKCCAPAQFMRYAFYHMLLNKSFCGINYVCLMLNLISTKKYNETKMKIIIIIIIIIIIKQKK